MKAENGQQREAAQALDIRTKSGLCRALTLHSFGGLAVRLTVSDWRMITQLCVYVDANTSGR